MIEQQGQVVRLQQENVFVRVGATTGCLSCESGKGCGGGIFARLVPKKPVTLEVPITTQSPQPKIGQQVLLGIPDVFFLKWTALLFGAPLVAADKRICAAVLGLMGTVGSNEETKSKIIEAAANIHCPVLFLMQLEDELFSRDRYLDLFDRLATTDKRIHAHPGLHPAVPVSELDESLAFLKHRFENGPYSEPEGAFGPISE